MDMPKHWFALYNEVRYCENGSGDGWHRDSFQNNYKVLIYLSDVTNIENGPFQYIPDNSIRWSKFKSMVVRFFRINWTRYSNVDKWKYSSVLGPEGTIFFVNTSLMHRGAPSEYRNALTYYLFYENIPSKYNDFLRPQN
jgi:hypothetical protein